MVKVYSLENLFFILFVVFLLQTACVKGKADPSPRSFLNEIKATTVSTAATPAIDAGRFYSIALHADGTVWTWGQNHKGQLGDGAAMNRPLPVQVKGLAGIRAVAGADSHAVVLKADGTVWAWGDNNYGQLGIGRMGPPITSPVQVNGLTGVVDVAAGQYHAAALKADGTVWAWGQNHKGQLGDGTTIDRSLPVQVMGLKDIVDVELGQDHGIALKSDGTVWTWGFNRKGQLGDGTTGDRLLPVQVIGLTDVVDVAGGQFHSAALKIDGTVWTWGYSEFGQLGDGSLEDRSIPVQVVVLKDVKDIEAGWYNTIALKNDGTVWMWGSNLFGQLGDGTNYRSAHFRIFPAPVKHLTGVIDIAGGEYHGIAMTSDGSVWTWGDNADGELGDGTASHRSLPVKVMKLKTP